MGLGAVGERDGFGEGALAGAEVGSCWVVEEEGLVKMDVGLAEGGGDEVRPGVENSFVCCGECCFRS